MARRTEHAGRHLQKSEFEDGWAGLLRRGLAESLGTFALTAVDGALAIIAQSDLRVTLSARALAAGLIVVTMIYATSNVSGAHFNPAVTLAFALRGVFPWRLMPGYWLSQILGALAAAAALAVFAGPAIALATTSPAASVPSALAMETFLTFLLVTVTLSTATRHQLTGPIAPLASGSIVILAGILGRPISGGSMNPARSLGPALVAGFFKGAWIYLAGPAAGAGLAVLIVFLIHPNRHEAELEAARGRIEGR